MTFFTVTNGTEHVYQFLLRGIRASDVRSAELLLQLDEDLQLLCFNKSLVIYLFRESGSKREIASIDISNEESWIQVDLSRVVSFWLSYPEANKGIQFSCSNDHESHVRQILVKDDFQNKRPYLRIYTDPKSHKRTKRSLSSSEESCCRLYPLYVDFPSIKWNFIIHPLGYMANYCHNSCRPIGKVFHSLCTH